jgi:uncharacterized protein YdeI (YjbR/CyaY-like superfamily)
MSKILAIFYKKRIMIVERENDKILVRFTASKNTSRIQSILDFLRYEELTSKSNVEYKDIDELVKESKSGRWEKNRKNINFED